MVKFENTQVAGWEAAIRGMRNPMNSWDRSDSKTYEMTGDFVLGEKDKELLMRLIHGGNEHCKALRMISVWVDISAPRFFWSEFDTYRVGVSANSQSTMHKLKDVDFNDYSIVDFPWGFDQDADSSMKDILFYISSLQLRMNQEREKSNKESAETYHRILKSMLPEGFIQTRTVNLNYAVLRNMYHQRKNHRLPQWSKDFTSWVESLPYSELITAA